MPKYSILATVQTATLDTPTTLLCSDFPLSPRMPMFVTLPWQHPLTELSLESAVQSPDGDELLRQVIMAFLHLFDNETVVYSLQTIRDN